MARLRLVVLRIHAASLKSAPNAGFGSTMVVAEEDMVVAEEDVAEEDAEEDIVSWHDPWAGHDTTFLGGSVVMMPTGPCPAMTRGLTPPPSCYCNAHVAFGRDVGRGMVPG